MDADVAVVVEVLADLSTYPSWNDLVSNAESIEQIDGDVGPVWRTTLRAQVGPFSRSKQLRFVRDHIIETNGATHIRFVRRELDERDHAEWTMEAEVQPVDASTDSGPQSRVLLTLAYGGGLWIPALSGVLSGAIERATTKLPAYLDAR